MGLFKRFRKKETRRVNFAPDPELAQPAGVQQRGAGRIAAARIRQGLQGLAQRELADPPDRFGAPEPEGQDRPVLAGAADEGPVRTGPLRGLRATSSLGSSDCFVSACDGIKCGRWRKLAAVFFCG